LKVYINQPLEEWSLSKIRNEWYAQRPSISTENVEEADIIWILDPNSWSSLDTSLLQEKKVLCSIHDFEKLKRHCESNNKDVKSEFNARDEIVDVYHVPNKYTNNKMSFHSDKPTSILEYWIDTSFWQPMSGSEARDALGIPPEKFVIGSFQRDTTNSSDTPILEKGPDILCRHIKNLNKKFLNNLDKEGNPDPVESLVLLAGGDRQYVTGILSGSSVPFISFGTVDQTRIRELYSCCDLYIASNRSASGPFSIMEAACMKTPIVSLRRGISESVLDANCIQNFNIDEKTYVPTKQDVDRNYQNVQEYDIEKHIQKYEDLLRQIYEDNNV